MTYDRPRPLPKPFTLPDPDCDPTWMTCEVSDCRHRGTRQPVLGAWNQPPTTPDPSRVFLLACGHVAF